MSEAAPRTPRSRGPGHRTDSPLRAPPRQPPLFSRMNSRNAVPRKAPEFPSSKATLGERHGSSPGMPIRLHVSRTIPSAESITFDVIDDNSIRFVSEEPTQRTASPAPGMQHSMASSEIEFHFEPSASPARGHSTVTEKSDIQFITEPSPHMKSMSPEPQPLAPAGAGRSMPVVGAAPPASESAPTPHVPTTSSTTGMAMVLGVEEEEEGTSTTVSSTTPPPPEALSAAHSSEDLSVASTPAQGNPNGTLSAPSQIKSEKQASTFTNPPRNDEVDQRYIDISDEDDEARGAEGDDQPGETQAHDAAAAGTTTEAAQPPRSATAATPRERRRSSYMPTVWDRPWKDADLQGATNKPPPMAPAPYERRKHGEHQPWDPKPSAAVRPSGAMANDSTNEEKQEVALAPRPRDPKPWLVNSVLDPRRRRSSSAGARSPRKAATSGASGNEEAAVAAAAAADGETPTVAPRRASQQISPRNDANDTSRHTFETSSEEEAPDTEGVNRASDAPTMMAAAGPFVLPEVRAELPSAVIEKEVREWNQLVTQQDTLQFLSNQARERERLVVEVANALEALKSPDARVTREVYAARDAVIRRTGADVNGDPLRPARQNNSRSVTPRGRRTPSREAFVDRLYPHDAVCAQAPDYVSMKREKEVRYPSVLSDEDMDEAERAENEEDLEDWRDERELLRDERAVLKQQQAELQFHIKRGTNIKGLTDIQPVTPRTPMARKLRKQSTAVDFFGYDRLAQLRIQAKEEENALENAKRALADVAARANDWPVRLRSRESATSAERTEAKERYMKALSALDETLSRARVLRGNLGAGQRSSSTADGAAPAAINGTTVPALALGAVSTEGGEASVSSSLSPRPTSVTPRGSAVPMSLRRQDSKQLLGAKLQEALALVVSAKSREEQVTTPRTGRQGRNGSRSARRRSTSSCPQGAKEYTDNRTPRAQSVYERLTVHKTHSARNRESPTPSPQRGDTR